MTNKPIAVGPSKHTQGGYVMSAHYGDGSAALIIYNKNGEGIEAKATVCLAPQCPPPKGGFVWLKGWSENEGIPGALEKAGIVKRTGETFPTGRVYAELAELLVEVPACT